MSRSHNDRNGTLVDDSSCTDRSTVMDPQNHEHSSNNRQSQMSKLSDNTAGLNIDYFDPPLIDYMELFEKGNSNNLGQSGSQDDSKTYLDYQAQN